MLRSELMRRLRHDGDPVSMTLVVVPIACGLTAAFIADGVTSGRYGLVIGSAVTVATSSIVNWIRRRG